MKTYYRLISMILMAVLYITVTAAQANADEYRWLKTERHKDLLVYTNIRGCTFMAGQLNETIRVILSRSGIKPVISESLVFQTGDEEGFILELMNHQLIDNNKIFMHISGQCLQYRSVYVYQFDIHFAVYDRLNSVPLLYASPKQSVIGTDNAQAIKNNFIRLLENSVEDYVSQNVSK